MRSLGMQAYRFSVAWGRAVPNGVGAANPAGIDFYERLVDKLLENQLKPIPTLYHWDLPAALDDRGGWLNRDIASWFADYAALMFRRLGDRVKKWATLNEPWVVTDGGYLHGTLAPGHRNLFEAPIASHNLLRAHGAAVQAYRAEGTHQIGIVVNIEPKHPASQDAADLAATARADAYMNRQYLDPVLRGEYPSEMPEIFGQAWPNWSASDMELIRQPIDFIGVNYYTRGLTRHDRAAWPVYAKNAPPADAVTTETAWEVFPDGLTQTLLWIKQRYGDIPLYITENGAAFADPPLTDGRVRDQARVDYLASHLRAAHAAIQAGADLRGYMVWSLFDNLEWSLGYSKRFGIVHVDFGTQQRTPKDSANFYSEVIASNGANLFASGARRAAGG